jgi:hypothetical protein
VALDSASTESGFFDEHSEIYSGVYEDASFSPGWPSKLTTSSKDDQILSKLSLIVKLKVRVPSEDSAPIAPTKRRRRRVQKVASSASTGDLAAGPALTSTDNKPSILMADGRVSATEYKKIGGIREPVPSLKPSGLYYSNRAEARRSFGKPNWMPPANDMSIPKTDSDMAVWVLALRNVVEDMSSYADSESKKLENR